MAIHQQFSRIIGSVAIASAMATSAYAQDEYQNSVSDTAQETADVSTQNANQENAKVEETPTSVQEATDVSTEGANQESVEAEDSKSSVQEATEVSKDGADQESAQVKDAPSSVQEATEVSKDSADQEGAKAEDTIPKVQETSDVSTQGANQVPAKADDAQSSAQEALTDTTQPANQAAKQESANDISKEVVDTHNSLREKHGAPPLAWDQTLADFAMEHTKKCNYSHSNGPYGENWAMGYQKPADAIMGWYSEVAKYDFKKPGYTAGTGHFTQVVWKATQKIGCAWVQCKSDRPGQTDSYMVCEYSPAGNVVSEGFFEQNVLPLKATN